MSNPSRQKGTWFESWLRDNVLRPLYYPNYSGPDDEHPLQRLDDAGRHKRAEDGDFIGVPYTIEAKSTQRPMFQQWARKLEKKVGKAWCLIWKGDRRAKTGSGPYVVMPLELWELQQRVIEKTGELDGSVPYLEPYYIELRKLQEFYS